MAVFIAAALSMSAMATLHPSLASRNAISRPIPLPAPVTYILQFKIQL